GCLAHRAEVTARSFSKHESCTTEENPGGQRAGNCQRRSFPRKSGKAPPCLCDAVGFAAVDRFCVCSDHCDPGGGGGTHHDRRWRSDAPGGCPGHDRPASDHSKNPAGTECATQQYLHRHNRSHRASHVTAASTTCCKGLTFLVSCRTDGPCVCDRHRVRVPSVPALEEGSRDHRCSRVRWSRWQGSSCLRVFVSLCACCAQVMGVKPMA